MKQFRNLAKYLIRIILSFEISNTQYYKFELKIQLFILLLKKRSFEPDTAFKNINLKI